MREVGVEGLYCCEQSAKTSILEMREMGVEEGGDSGGLARRTFPELERSFIRWFSTIA